jgi:hypothetical protein
VGRSPTVPHAWLGELIDPQRLRPQREAHQARGRRGSRARTRSARCLLRVPRRLGHALEPKAALRQGAHRELRNQHRARIAEPLDHCRILLGHARLVRLRAESRQDALGVEQVFQPERNPVQRSPIVPRADLPIRFRSLRQCQVFGGRDQAKQFRRVLLHARQVHLCEVRGRDRTRFQQRRKVHHAPERHILQVRRRLHRGRFGNRRLEALRSLDRLAVRQTRVECKGGFGIDRHVRLAQRFIIGERLVGAAQHHVEFRVLEFQPHQLERPDHLFLGDAHRQILKSALPASTASGALRRRRCRSSALLRIRLPRRGENRN